MIHVTQDLARPKESRAAAIVVAYRPDRSKINRLIRILAREYENVYIMDNGGGREAVTLAPGDLVGVHVIDMDGNQGIGEALNLGFQFAKGSGVQYVGTFDQDSEPPLGQLANLIKALGRLEARGVSVAAVGPKIVDPRNAQPLEHPFMGRRMGWPTAVRCTHATEHVEADFFITSGCLIPLAVFEVVGPFDRELFVDYIDVEWCLRARSLGYRSYGICSVTMLHELGTGVSTSALGVRIMGQTPVRRYYYARNTVRLLKHSYVPSSWKARMILGLLARLLLLPIAVRFAAGWTKEWAMLARGINDGISGLGGPFNSRP